jgi:hypothetical protein
VACRNAVNASTARLVASKSQVNVLTFKLKKPNRKGTTEIENRNVAIKI